jgi:hypothetical protein
MAYYIFLKSLRRLEEFRKNPHIKIPPKSPSTNFQSLGKFKNPIFNSETIFPCFRPSQSCGPFGLWPSQPTGRTIPAGRNSPGRPIQPTRWSRLHGKYVSLLDHAFPSRPPLPHLSVNRAPPVRFTTFPAPADPGRKSLTPPLPRAAAPRLGCPRAFTALPHHSSPLIPFKTSLNEP